MKLSKGTLVLFICIVVCWGMLPQPGTAQSPFGPWGIPWLSNPFYAPFSLYGGAFPPFFGRNTGWGYPLQPIIPPSAAILSPYQRRPNATVIFTAPTLTAVSGAAPGVILIGATGVLGATAPVVAPATAVAAAVPPSLVTAAAPAPAPLLSILSVLYASALLDGKALLSTANPLLFAYLTTLVL
ncbi:MAG: hypothetical protein ACMUIS_05110 [bacterium]